ncbi:MAG TPA: restriction endonuclease [Gammaproteobacteria bacterium]|nr:restriction endonuclease [Gammaproteobacteria bacterium]
MDALLIGAVALALVLTVTMLATRRGRRDPHNLRQMEDEAFGHRLGTAFGARGFHVTHRDAEPGPVQLVLERDGKRYLVTFRHWRAEFVGANPVAELLQAIHAEGADGGYIVTTGRFTGEAREAAANSGIELIAGRELAELVAGHSGRDRRT